MENTGTQPPGYPPADQPQAPLQRRSIVKRADEKVAPSDNLANVIVYLSSLYSQLKDEEQRPTPAAAVPDPGQKVLQSKRLARTGTQSEQTFAEVGQRSDSTSLTGTWGGGFAGSAEDTSRRRWRWLIGGGFTLLMLVGLSSFLWQHERQKSDESGWGTKISSHRMGVVNRPADATISDEALKFANLTLDAIARGELSKASELLDEAQTRQILLPGMYYQGALVALSERNEGKAEQWTDRAIEANEAIPECLYLRANEEVFKGDYKAAASTLEEAARNAPFTPRYFFFWAECLRRQGTPRLALDQFKQALRCRPGSADTELILFKIGLARIEVGDDADFQKDLTNKLAQEPVSGDTLLLAAANEINRGDNPAAAAYLLRAGRTVSPAILKTRLRDYVFRTQSEQKDIAPVWSTVMAALAASSPPQRAHKMLIDPATRGLADADPAAW